MTHFITKVTTHCTSDGNQTTFGRSMILSTKSVASFGKSFEAERQLLKTGVLNPYCVYVPSKSRPKFK